MPGQQLSLQTVKEVLDDASAAGVRSVRLYGGEPLLHAELPRMVEHAHRVRVRPYVTTNAVLLREKIDALHAAGLRDVTIGFYGTGGDYDDYVQRAESFERVEEGVAYVRRRYGHDIDLQINWLLMRPSAHPAALNEMWTFARKYDLKVRVDLVHYSLPYFEEGPDRVLQFRPEDRPAIERVVIELLRLKREDPDRLMHSLEGLRSIPDWLRLGPNMKVPCTAYDLIWVGADGTVQMCYVTFKLGNLHEKRLREMLFTKEHHCFARDAFQLNCPNCHCSSNERIMRDAGSRRRYGEDPGFAAVGELSQS